MEDRVAIHPEFYGMFRLLICIPNVPCPLQTFVGKPVYRYCGIGSKWNLCKKEDEPGVVAAAAPPPLLFLLQLILLLLQLLLLTYLVYIISQLFCHFTKSLQITFYVFDRLYVHVVYTTVTQSYTSHVTSVYYRTATRGSHAGNNLNKFPLNL